MDHQRPSPNRQIARAVCLLFLGLLGASSAEAQSRLNRPPPRYIQLSAPDQKEGATILADMRNAGLAGDYYLEFELRVLPRRGDEHRIPGRLWGTRNTEGPMTRLVLTAPSETGAANGKETRLLVQGGPRPSAWSWPATDGATTITVDNAALFEPLAGTDLSAFDLQMPFLYWPDFVYEGKTRLYDRPADTFLLYPPASLAARRPELAAMRVYLDPQYHALMQAEQIGENERVLKSMRVVELKKIGDQWMVKAIELRDETTRNKTRFVVTSAGLKRDFSNALFEPGNLSGSFRAPSELTSLRD